MLNYNINNSNNNSNSSNNYSYNNGTQTTILEGSIVLCQHGLFGTETTMDPLFENLKQNTFSSFYNCIFCDNLLRSSELSSDNIAIKEIDSLISKYPKKNIFVRTLFKNPTSGLVSIQAEELKQMILQIKSKHPNVPIVLIGYSKGGVVNCKCAINNEGLIDRIINIGTPHDDTLFQDAVRLICRVLQKKFKIIDKIPNPLAKLAINGLIEIVNSGVDSILNEVVTYKRLKFEWNSMKKRPIFTPIAGEAIVIDGNIKGDLVVPTNSAIAKGFKERKFENSIDNFIISDGQSSYTIDEIVDNATGSIEDILSLLANAYTVVKDKNALEIINLLKSLSAVMISNIINKNFKLNDSLKLAHTSFANSKDFILTHNTTAMRVLAGFNN